MAGACPPPRVKHFYRESLFLLIAFAGICSSTFFGITIVPTRGLFIVSLYLGVCTTYPQGGWARYISSGRMSSRTTSCSSTTLVLVTIYPQGGWARYISSGRMSSRTTSCSSTTLVLVTIHPQGGWARYISSGRMSSRTIRCSSTTMVLDTTYPQGGWAHYISSGRMSSRTTQCSPHHLGFSATLAGQHISSGRMSSLHILREDELEDYLWSSPLPWCLPPHILREDELATYPQWGWALEQFVVLLLLWWLSGKVIGLFLNSSFYYRLRLGMPSLWRSFPQYPQGGWARYISSVRMSLRIKFWFSL